MPDISIHVPPVATLPTSYTVSGTQDITLRFVTGSFDGTGASGSWVPAVQIVDPSGLVVGTFPLATTLAVGASADVTFFPGRVNPQTTTPTPPVTPVGSIYAWYDFSDTTTILLDGSGKISTIKDKTGNGHDCSQATAAQRPSETTVNGLNAGFFNDAATQTLVCPTLSPALSQPLSIAAVFTQDVAPGASYFPGPVSGNHSGSDCWIFNNGPFNSLAVESDGSAVSIGIVGPYTQQLVIGVYNFGSSRMQLNASTNTGAVGSGGMTAITLGRGHDNVPGHTDYLNGKLCEVMIFQGALTTSQQSLNATYLKGKWATP